MGEYKYIQCVYIYKYILYVYIYMYTYIYIYIITYYNIIKFIQHLCLDGNQTQLAGTCFELNGDPGSIDGTTIEPLIGTFSNELSLIPGYNNFLHRIGKRDGQSCSQYTLG
jgi:hypothetical protein